MACKAKQIDLNGKQLGEVDLSEEVFGVAQKDHLLFDAVRMQLASRRQGTAKVKTRAEVRGGGAKPYKQKGTGNARRGSSRSPLIVGGARIFGPVPRDYSYRLPRKVHGQALRTALSQKQREGKLFVVKDFTMKEFKTKIIASLMKNLKVVKALVVDSDNPMLSYSVRNLKDAKYVDARGLNVFDVLKYDNVLISSKCLEAIEKGTA